VRNPAGFAYQKDLEAWAADGIDVVRTVSQPGDSGWTGLTGYVQEHIGEEPLGDAVAFVCGQKGMVEGVTTALVKAGMPRENIFLNF
jgi:NAD(P)H-flavin reductase